MTWPLVELAEVAQLNWRGEAPEPERCYRLAGVRWWGEGAYEYRTILGSETQAKQLYRIEADDLIINKIWARHGSIAVADQSLAGAYGSSEFPTFTLDREQVEPRFLHWFSKTKLAWSQCELLSRGTSGKNRVKPERFLSVRTPLPPLPEQRRIVARLDAALVAVERASKLINEVDHDLLQAARNIIWRAGEEPNAWAPCRSFLRQRSLDVRVDADTDYAFAGVYSFGRGIFRSEVKSGSTFSYAALTRIRTDDFIYPKLMAWEGALGVVPAYCDGLVVSPEFPVFEVDANVVRPAVVDIFFRDPRTLPMLRLASSGTNMRRRRIQPGRFLELKMPIPSADEQAMVLALLERRKAVVDARRDSVAAVQALLPAMLNEAFGRKADG